MPVSFSDLPSPPVVRVTIRGKQFDVRALSSHEAFRVRTRALRRPAAPPVKNPTKGALTDEIVPAEWDADYRRELGVYSWKTAVLSAAIAIDYQPDGPGAYTASMNDERLATWGAAAIEELSKTLVDEEIAAINRASDAAASGAVEAAEKN